MNDTNRYLLIIFSNAGNILPGFVTAVGKVVLASQRYSAPGKGCEYERTYCRIE
jgi:hypothetical protein